jgi:hypothetical protein
MENKGEMMEPLFDVSFCAHLIRTTLEGGPFPDIERSVSIILGTMAQESCFTYTRQLGGGPARGLGQIEPATEQSLWLDFLAYNPEISAYVTSRCGRGGPDEVALEYDLVYGILLMRVLYLWRDPAPMPSIGDVPEAASRWKKYYNTFSGSGTEEQFIESYAIYVSPHYPPTRRSGHG